jgi:hypothetical protein
MIDTNKLKDVQYMDRITSTEEWKTLEKFIRNSTVLDLFSHLEDDRIKRKMIDLLSSRLEVEDIEELKSAILANDFIENLMEMLYEPDQYIS